MHTTSRVVRPFILPVDGQPVTDEDVAQIEALRPELQRWWLNYSRAMLMADVIVVPDRGDWDPADFHAPGGAYGAALELIRNRYPSEIGGEHIPLVFLKGVTAAELGSLGWAGRGFATVSWDVIISALADPQGKGHWPAGIAAHELGHSLGYGHIQEPFPHIMWHWWMWPGVHPPIMPTDASLRLFSAEDVQGSADRVCPMPPMDTDG